jgi:hypothetical protein
MPCRVQLQRTAQDLLLAVCVNCTQEDRADQEVMQQLLKIRIKPKPLQTHYLNCIRYYHNCRAVGEGSMLLLYGEWGSLIERDRLINCLLK